MDKEIALDYLCSLEEEFIARADREVESGLNEQDIDEEEEKLKIARNEEWSI